MNLPGVQNMWRAAKRLYRCEQGAEGLEKLLIVGAIVIPLLGLLILFRNELSEWVSESWESVLGDAQDTP